VAELETKFGKGTEVSRFGVGDVPELPYGGEARSFAFGRYTFDVYFDPEGVSKGFQLTDGLEEEAFPVEHWALLLDRFGFEVYELPDAEALAAWWWYDFSGYKIALFVRVADQTVWSVLVWKLR